MLWTILTSTRWQKMKVEDTSRQWEACNPFATQVILSPPPPPFLFSSNGSFNIALPDLELIMHARLSQTHRDAFASVSQVLGLDMFPTTLGIL